MQVAETFPIEERKDIIVITPSNHIIAADPALLEGWIITSNTVPNAVEDSNTGVDSESSGMEVVNGDIDGTIIEAPIDIFDPTGSYGSSSGSTTGGSTTSGGGSSGGSSNGDSTTTGGGESGGSTGNAATSGGSTGSSNGDSTGGSGGSSSSGGSSGGGSSSGGGTTGGTTTGGGSNGGTTGGTTGGTDGGTTGGSSGGSNPLAGFDDQFWNWESYTAGFPGVVNPVSPHVYNAPTPHQSGLYCRIMSKVGFGYISAKLFMPDLGSIHCAPLKYDLVDNQLADQFKDVPYNYVKMDCTTPGKHFYAEAGLKYDRWIVKQHLQDKFWKPFLGYKAQGMLETEYLNFTFNTPVGENRDFDIKLYSDYSNGKLSQIAKIVVGPIDHVYTFVKQYGFVTSIAQAKLKFNLQTPGKKPHNDGSCTEPGTGCWIEHFGIHDVYVAPQLSSASASELFSYASHVTDSVQSRRGHAMYYPTPGAFEQSRVRHITSSPTLNGWLTTIDNTAGPR